MVRVELRQLECFVTLAEELNFGRAATRLRMSQPPLTRLIRRLEEIVGVPLFTRTTRKVELTAAGMAYLPEARAALHQIQNGVEMAKRGARGEVGELTIAVEASSIFDPVFKSVRLFRERYPLVNLIVQSLDTDDQADALREGRIEVGFIVPPLHDQRIVCEPVISMPLVAALPATHRLASRRKINLAELAAEPFVLSPASHKCGLLDNVIAACRAAGFTPRVVQEAHEMQLMLAFIGEGIGISILPQYVASLGKPGIVCKPLADCKASLELAIAWRKGAMSPVVEAFAAVVREVRDTLANANAAPPAEGSGTIRGLGAGRIQPGRNGARQSVDV